MFGEPGGGAETLRACSIRVPSCDERRKGNESEVGVDAWQREWGTQAVGPRRKSECLQCPLQYPLQ